MGLGLGGGLLWGGQSHPLCAWVLNPQHLRFRVHNPQHLRTWVFHRRLVDGEADAGSKALCIDTVPKEQDRGSAQGGIRHAGCRGGTIPIRAHVYYTGATGP